MDDAVIAGIPAQHDGLAKKSAVKSAPAAKAVAMKWDHKWKKDLWFRLKVW